MSDIRFRCPECRGKLAIDSTMALSEVPCPLCGKSIRAWGADLLDIRFHCPACEGKLVVDRKGAGDEVTCPKCNKVIQVPAGPEAAVAPPITAIPKLGAPRPTPATGPSKAGTLSKEEMDFLTSHAPASAPAHRAKG